MQRKSENPFQAHPDWHHNACISNPGKPMSGKPMVATVQFWEIGSHYMRAADALVNNAVEDRSVLDVYVFPLIFLYRHAVEIFLKDLLWQSHYLACGKKGFITDKSFKTHDLLKLWQQLKGNCQKVLGADFPLIPDDVKLLEEFFAQIQKHDPGPDAFRFPFDAKGILRTPPSITSISVPYMRASTKRLNCWGI